MYDATQGGDDHDKDNDDNHDKDDNKDDKINILISKFV